MILVHVQKMYNIFRLLTEFRITVVVFFLFFIQTIKRKLSPLDEKLFRDSKSKY